MIDSCGIRPLTADTCDEAVKHLNSVCTGEFRNSGKVDGRHKMV